MEIADPPIRKAPSGIVEDDPSTKRTECDMHADPVLHSLRMSMHFLGWGMSLSTVGHADEDHSGIGQWDPSKRKVEESFMQFRCLLERRCNLRRVFSPSPSYA